MSSLITTPMSQLVPISTIEALLPYHGHDLIMRYLSLMIAHHQHAIQMAHGILHNTCRQDVTCEAQEIIASQTRELQMMQRWLSQWYKKQQVDKEAHQIALSDTLLMDHMKNGQHRKMDDVHFLSDMIAHHHTANAMNIILLQRITDCPFQEQVLQLRGLAHKMIDDQPAQIERMIDILKALGC